MISEKIVLRVSKDSSQSIGLQYVVNGNDVCGRSEVEGARLGVARDGENVQVKIQRAYEIPTFVPISFSIRSPERDELMAEGKT